MMESEPGTPYSVSGLSRSSSMSLHPGSGDLPTWIPDSDAADCMSCKRAFGFSRRRHHCRSCGWCICSACSPRTFILAGSVSPQRVCNNCYINLQQVAQIRVRAGLASSGVRTPMPPGQQQRAPPSVDAPGGAWVSASGSRQVSPPKSKTPSQPPTHGHSLSSPLQLQPSMLSPSPSPQPVQATLSPPPSGWAQMLPLTLPEWTYAFKPFCGALGAEVSIGRLGVLVLAAANMPVLDELFSSPAPYCKARMGKVTKRTHTLAPLTPFAAANPSWIDGLSGNATTAAAGGGAGEGDGNGTNFLLFDVSNVQETVHVEVWEHYAVGSDQLVARVEIPLSSLVKPENLKAGTKPRWKSYEVTAWFPLIVTVPQQKGEKALAVSTGKVAAPKKRGSTSGGLPGSAASAPVAPAQIQLTLSYNFSTLGEFWSHFTAPPPSAHLLPNAAAARRASALEARKSQRAELRAAKLAAAKTKQKKNAAANAAAESKEDGAEDLPLDEAPEIPEEDENDDANLDEADEDWAHLTHMDSQNEALEPFRLQSSYDIVRKIVAVVVPLYTLLASISGAMTSNTPLLWLALSMLALVLGAKPWLIPLLLLVLLLRHMVFAYVYRVWNGGRPHVHDTEWMISSQRSAAAAAASGAASSASSPQRRDSKGSNAFVSALQFVNPLNLVSLVAGGKGKKDDDASQQVHPDLLVLERILLPHIRAGFDILGFALDESEETSLAAYQSLWARGVERIVAIVDTLNWSRGMLAGNTLLVALALGVGYQAYFSTTWIVALVMTLLVTRHTVLGEKVHWLLNSTSMAVSDSKIARWYVERMSKKY